MSCDDYSQLHAFSRVFFFVFSDCMIATDIQVKCHLQSIFIAGALFQRVGENIHSAKGGQSPPCINNTNDQNIPESLVFTVIEK